MGQHSAGVFLIAEYIKRGLSICGKDETEMAVKRQDIDDLCALLAWAQELSELAREARAGDTAALESLVAQALDIP